MQFSFFDKSRFYVTDTIIEKEIIKKEINKDSILAAHKMIEDSIKREQELLRQKYLDSVLNAEKKIQFPNDDITILSSFFKKLDKAKNKKVRIMHYEDSQIEA